MPVTFGSALTVISMTWVPFKATVAAKSLPMQWLDDGIITTVFAVDGPLVYTAIMYDGGNVPSGLQDSYSVAQNNADLADFQTNYQATANQRINRTDRFGNPVIQEFDEAVAMGALPSNVIVGRATGYVAAPTLNTYYSVLSATYIPQTSAAQRSVKSSSANDAANGTGARTLTINYLNNSMVLKQDTVTLNGTTAVDTNVIDIQFIESMIIASCGTGLLNAGNITMMTGLAGAGATMAQINLAENQTFYVHHYVPVGVSCYVRKHTGAGSLSVGRAFLEHTGDPRATLPTLQIGDIIVHSGGFTEDHEYDVPLVVVGPDRILALEFPVASNASNYSYASFDYSQF